MAICKIKYCSKESRKAGFCSSHYMTDWLSRDRGECSKEGCNNKIYIRGICLKHYTIWRRTRPDLPMCSAEYCSNRAVSKGMCHKHYKKNLRKAIKCKIAGCENMLHSTGLCTTHWRQYKKSILISIECLVIPGIPDIFNKLLEDMYNCLVPPILGISAIESKEGNKNIKDQDIRPKICKEKGCNKPHRAKGFCVGHYNRWKSAQEAKICKIENCKKFVYAKRLCSKHYQQQQKKETPPKETFTLCKIESCNLRSRRSGMCKKHADQFLEKPKCTIEGCKRVRYSRKLCSSHYYIWRQENIDNKCKVEGCDKVVRAKDLCSAHYQRHLQGKPLDTPPRRRAPVEAVSIREVSRKPKEPLVHVPIEIYKKTIKPAEPVKKRQAEKIIKCNVKKCNNPAKTKGLCVKHFLRYKRNLAFAEEQQTKQDHKETA